MITLALDTSTPVGSVALLDGDRLIGEEQFGRDGLFPALEKLNPGSFDLIAVGIGPGSFTGIRAGIAAAKGLALPRAALLRAVNSFDAIALGASGKMPADCAQMCVLCDGRRGEVYSGLYDRAGGPLGACRLATLEALAGEVHAPVWFVGPEMERYRVAIRELFGGFATVCESPVYPSAVAVGRLALAGRCSDRLEPLYLRTPAYKTL
jgi:tRNA threonylcarbamoyladenosine biosynthesis protein TsaB